MRVSRLITNRRLFILLGSVIAVMVIAGLTLGSGARSASWPERVIMDVQNTVGGWLYRPVSKLTAFLGGVHNLREMYQENAKLKAELQNYASLKLQLQEQQAKNVKLKQMLGFKNRKTLPGYQLIPASILTRDPSHWSSEISIDVGTSDGVTNNMPVVAAEGSLVGKVLQAGTYSSKVILITDTQVGDGVSTQVLTSDPQKQPYGIVVGAPNQPGKLRMNFLSPGINVQAGDPVVTSGLGHIYPQGLLVGQIVSVGSGDQGLSQTAEVQPTAAFPYLSDVFVVRQKGKQ